MSTHTIEGFIYHEQDPDHRQYDWCTPQIGFQQGTTLYPEVWPHRVKVRDHSFEVEVPDDFDPTVDLIANLVEKRRLAQVELAEKLMAIDEQISKLSAITYTPAAEPVTVYADDEPF